MNPNRRRFLFTAATAAVARSGYASADSGQAVAGFDAMMARFVVDHGVPGVSLAIARNGRQVYARGFGRIGPGDPTLVRPDALFRIASVSKPVTAAAVLRLADRGKLKLDDPIVQTAELDLPDRADPRWKRVTVRHCLNHTGGWDRDTSFDPIGRAWAIADELDIRPPIGPDRVIEYMTARPLDFDPGTRYAYSNLGYLLLGRAVAVTSGKSYEAHVRAEILAPLGITQMRLGRARVEHRADGEVRHTDRDGRTGPALYPPKVGETVPLPDGAINFEAFGSHGGWIASAGDLVRFADAFADPDRCPLMSARSVRELFARPATAKGDAYYAAGWMVRPRGAGGRANVWHAGFIPGSEALLVRRGDGLTWAVLFNTQNTPDGGSLTGAIDGKLHVVANAVTDWPTGT